MNLGAQRSVTARGKTATALLVGLIAGLLLAEVLVRVLTAGPGSYGPEVVRAFEAEPERLLSPQSSVTLDASGLYDGAGEVLQRTSFRRLIEPDPVDAARHHVLFLGGSTTEALYVPESGRWVALLNDPPAVSTHNAGVSGANLIDGYHHLRYLTDQMGLQVDLVVVMTTINDFTWFRRFAELGSAFSEDTYAEGIARWAYERDARADRAHSRLKFLREHVRFVDLVVRAFTSGDSALDYRSAATKAVDFYRQVRAGRFEEFAGRRTSYADCLSRMELDHFLEAERSNFALLAREAARHGAELLAIAEPSALDSPPPEGAEDFREPMPCGGGLLSFEDAQRYLRRVGERYVEAADWASIQSFDLAAALAQSSIPGNRLFYDGVHLTPLGCAEVARILRPVIGGILAERDL